jgi:hydroxyacylglutathione hydrolase
MSIKITPIMLHYFFGVNCYLIKNEEGYYLVDTAIKKVRKQLDSEIFASGCRQGDLKLVILTHGHIDHVGNALYLKNKYGGKIAMHRDDSEIVDTGKMFGDESGLIVKIVGFFTRLLGLSSFERFTPDVYLEDGQSLSPYGLDATIIHNPGHSRGSVSLLTREGDLFCGDLYTNNKQPEKASIIQDHDQLEKSYERLKKFEVKMVYPGHGKPFSMDQISS